jgi:hypothetical protein
MKYSIAGYSQKKLIEHGLDCRDAEFIRWFADFLATGQMKTHVENDAVYSWLDHQHIIDELPILGRSTLPSVGKYINHLVEKGVLEKHTIRRGTDKGTAVFYRIVPSLMHELTTDTPIEHRNDQSSANEHYHDRTSATLAQSYGSDSSTRDSSTNKTNKGVGNVVDKATRAPKPEIGDVEGSEPEAPSNPAPPVVELQKEPEERRIRDLLAYNGIQPDKLMKQRLSDFKNDHGVDALAELINLALKYGLPEKKLKLVKPDYFNTDFLPYLNTYEPPPPEQQPKYCEKHGQNYFGSCRECQREEREQIEARKKTPEGKADAAEFHAKMDALKQKYAPTGTDTKLPTETCEKKAVLDERKRQERNAKQKLLEEQARELREQERNNFHIAKAG